MNFQSLVERFHLSKWQEVKALCNTADQAWDELGATKLRNVYERWKLVLDLIMSNEEKEELSAEDIDNNGWTTSHLVS